MSQSLAILPAAPPEPQITPRLAAGMTDFAATWTPANRYAAAIVEEAKSALPAIEAYLRPASAAGIELWLLNLRKGTAAISDEHFAHRVMAVQLASGDLPAWVWCVDALRDALRDPRCRFFPSAPDVDSILRPRASAALHRAWLVQRVAGATPIAEEPPEAVQPLPTALIAAALKSSSIGQTIH